MKILLKILSGPFLRISWKIKDKKGTLGLCLSSLHLSGEHLMQPYGKLDPADGTSTWDSLHPLSSGSLVTLGKLLPGLGIWRSGQRG